MSQDVKLTERLRDAAADAAAEEYGVAGLLAEAVAALEAAREDRWRLAGDPPEGAMGCWTEDVITVSNHGTVCTIAYFHDPMDGVWQRPGRYVSGEEVVMWRPLPAIDQARGKGGGE